MIERVIELSIRYRWLVCLGGLLLGLGGLYAAWNTPVDAIPDLSENQVIVFADWAGHSPREVEEQVTFPLAVRLRGLPGTRTVRTSSDLNFAMIHVIFDDTISQATARRQVAERLEGVASLVPEGVRPYLGPDSPATGQIFWYTVEGSGFDLARLREIQDFQVGPQLGSVAGVAEVASVGGFTSEFAVEVDPRELSARGITLAQVKDVVARGNRSAGASVVPKGGAEFVVRSAGRLGIDADDEFQPAQAIADLAALSVLVEGGESVPLGSLARISLVPAARRGVLEKDGSEAVGGVVLMRSGENPLEVTRRVRAKMTELAASLPAGVRIVPGYDRTPLILGAVTTVTYTLVEATITACLCVVLVLRHWRSSLVIVVTLPLATLCAFVAMWVLRRSGVTDIQSNIMSLAGLAISVGVLVDSSIVMTENVMHNLRLRFGDEPARGDLRSVVTAACQTVGRPIFFSVLIMLLSFVPVFALGGLEGRMFRPLAWTKCLALAAAAGLAVTLVPALCALLIKGRIRAEEDNWLVRGVAGVYRPLLSFLLDRPAVMIWIMGLTFLVGFAPLGSIWVARVTLALALLSAACLIQRPLPKWICLGSFLLAALVAPQIMQPLQREFLTPLDEGTLMDMPITVPRIGVAQASDDLKARNMVLCRFPEVEMVMGKAGRAETPTDPAPIDMIETMIEFRPRELWPRRSLSRPDARRQTAAALAALVERKLVLAAGLGDRERLIDKVVDAALVQFDAQLREFTYQRNQEQLRAVRPELVRFVVGRWAERLSGQRFAQGKLSDETLAALAAAAERELPVAWSGALLPADVQALVRRAAAELARREKRGPALDLDADRLTAEAAAFARGKWREHMRQLDGELVERGAELFTRLAIEELLLQAPTSDETAAVSMRRIRQWRTHPPKSTPSAAGHHGGPAVRLPDVEPVPALDELQAKLTKSFAARLVLWRKDRAELTSGGGELDQAVNMPGWANVWTMPIQNRVDMLATGVNTTVGIRVLGSRQQDVVRIGEEIAQVVKKIPGAAGVIADPIRGKGYIDIRLDRAAAAEFGVDVGDAQDAIDAALTGIVATHTAEGRRQRPVRVRFPRTWREDEETLRSLPIGVRGGSVSSGRLATASSLAMVPLEQVASVRLTDGPATIKGENGLLRNYVRLNVRDRDALDFVAEARREVARQVPLPEGVVVEWTGQFEHQQRSQRTMYLIVPLVVLTILLVLYLTYKDLADALLMLLAVPGAVAGGILLQWLLGEKLTVTVLVGYIACFGMATATGVIMLVYLREAVEKAGGLAQLTPAQLRTAVLDGAVHRLRPKLLTEVTTIVGLAPLLWSHGVGAEIIRPMAIPVFGGILIADEVIDLFLPVMFYWVRRRRLPLRPVRPQNAEFVPSPGYPV